MTPLVLVPGLMCDADVWKPLYAHWPTDLTCQVIDPGARDSLTSMAKRLLEQAPERFALAGFSMGGRVALEVMRLEPKRVERLALLDTGHLPLPAGSAGAQEIAKRHALLKLARERGVRTMAAEWVQGMVKPSRLPDADLIESILQMFERRTVDTFAAQLQALIRRPGASDVLRSLRVPTLIACGRDDAWAPVSQHEAMQRLAPHAMLRVIEDAGHMVQMERPEQTAAVMLEWLTAQD
jgi:pimeloyl-ACP methyl ester carboxylesterase